MATCIEATVKKNGYTFRATVYEGGAVCLERVSVFKPEGGMVRIHEAEFPTSNLGSASRNEYARVMCASIADAWCRENKA